MLIFLVSLFPFFIYSLHSSTTTTFDHSTYLLSIDLFLNSPLHKYRDAPLKVEKGLDRAIYHRKYLSALDTAQSLPHQALFYLFDTLNKTYSTPFLLISCSSIMCSEGRK